MAALRRGRLTAILNTRMSTEPVVILNLGQSNGKDMLWPAVERTSDANPHLAIRVVCSPTAAASTASAGNDCARPRQRSERKCSGGSSHSVGHSYCDPATAANFDLRPRQTF